jgi:hypothetical protein
MLQVQLIELSISINQINDSFEFEVMPRDEWGVPAHIPPDLSTQIVHTYQVPPQYFPFLKKIGEDSPHLQPFCDKLIKGVVSL